MINSLSKTDDFTKKHEIINKNIKIVNLEILKVKTWFGDKDLYSKNLLVKPMIL